MRDDQGIALITVLMLTLLISAMLVGTTALVLKDQRARFQDHDRTDTFYVAHAGLEKITNDLGRLFSSNYTPTNADLARVTANPPALGGMSFTLPGGAVGSGYTITKETQLPPGTLNSGPFAGLQGIVTPYTIEVTAHSPQGSEVSLRRQVNAVAIPVFQFGIFSETDLSFFPGPTFNFGGRVHTNGNLYLAKQNSNGTRLVLNDRVTAFGEVIRNVMANGNVTNPDYAGEVKILATGGGCDDIDNVNCKAIGVDEGSIVTLSPLKHNATSECPACPSDKLWSRVSNTKYGKYITSGAFGNTTFGTGAQRLNLPITANGEPAIELIRRPRVGEDPTLTEQRYYSMASVRILLSDRLADLTTLVGKGPGNPVDLGIDARMAKARAGNPYRATAGDPIVTGFLKIEMQNQAGDAWVDVTNEILALGFRGSKARVQSGGACNGDAGAIIRLQRYRDDASNTPNCNPDTGSQFWSNALYDAREGVNRDNNSTTIPTDHVGVFPLYMGGVMHYIELDIRNLRIWLAQKRTANQIMTTTGYVVYFSDRRGNRNGNAGPETGEYGFEDVVTVNGGKDTGEDINGNNTLQTYGGVAYNSLLPAGNLTPLINTSTPYSQFINLAPLAANLKDQLFPNKAATVARANKPIFFRRALKLVNGSRDNMYWDSPGLSHLGLTVVAENPIYIQGDYNATLGDGVPGTYNLPHVACAVIGDAVTLLSNSWSDAVSFDFPHMPGSRVASDTVYRTAIVSGKGMSFPKPTGLAADFGTDGGTHNFLRYLEAWNPGAGQRTLYYRGSMVSLYTSLQGDGTFKCCTNVYGPPIRAYVFDNDFLNADLLPPRTPMFRAIDVTSFTRLAEPPTP
jgi:hypothetical protein